MRRKTGPILPRRDARLTDSDTDEGTGGGPRLIGFLLLDGVALMSFAAAIEPFRGANVLSGRELYRWLHVAPGAGEVAASTGLRLPSSHRVGAELGLDTLLVCAGGTSLRFDDAATLQWLRRLARRGTRLGGVSAGPFVLARAGLLDGHRCTVHWEHLPAFVETFPHLDPTRALYEIDRDRLTCAGGIAALDMVLALIAADHGDDLADEVGEWFLRSEARPGTGPQRRSLRDRYRTASPALLTVLELVERHLEEPLDRATLARAAGVSVRQVERLFAAHLGRSLGDHYRSVRLDRARLLLRQTAMPVVEIGLACGFASASHFSRSYRAAFGHPPAAERRRS